MKDLLDKLSSYNIFNYLFPGILFSIILSKSTTINLIQEDIIVGAFFYYFIGLIISRFGSLIIEPFLKWIKFVKFADYPDFVKTSKDDDTIVILSEVNNMYRTLLSLILIVLISKFYLYISSIYNWSNNIHFILIISMLLLMFLFAYRKQTMYIYNRIKANLK